MRTRHIFVPLLGALLASAPGQARESGAGASGGREGALGCLARNVFHEARGEGATGMVAVGAVAMNRVMEGGGDPCSVIYQRVGGRCQFSWVCAGKGQPGGGEDWSRALAVAEALLSERGLPDPTHGATFFSRCGRAPSSGLRMTVRIGAHCFWERASGGSRQAARGVSYALDEDSSRRHGWSVRLQGRSAYSALDEFVEVAEAVERRAQGPERTGTRQR